MPRYNNIERIGVSYVQSRVVDEIGWVFREQGTSDFGIDAHIEQVIEGNPTGALIALQIKSGESHFVANEDSLTFYPDNHHVNYWLNHTLPVIIVAYYPIKKKAYFSLVEQKNLVKTVKKWKIKIPFKNEVSAPNVSVLNNIITLNDAAIKNLNFDYLGDKFYASFTLKISPIFPKPAKIEGKVTPEWDYEHTYYAFLDSLKKTGLNIDLKDLEFIQYWSGFVTVHFLNQLSIDYVALIANSLKSDMIPYKIFGDKHLKRGDYKG